MENLVKSARFAALLGSLAGILALGGCASQSDKLAELPSASGDAQYSTRYRMAC